MDTERTASQDIKVIDFALRAESIRKHRRLQALREMVVSQLPGRKPLYRAVTARLLPPAA